MDYAEKYIHVGKKFAHCDCPTFQMRRSIRGPYDSNEHTRYVEMYLVNDYRTVSVMFYTYSRS